MNYESIVSGCYHRLMNKCSAGFEEINFDKTTIAEIKKLVSCTQAVIDFDSSMEKHTESMKRTEFVLSSNPLIRFIVKDSKDPLKLHQIARSITQLCPDEFKSTFWENATKLEKAIRNVYEDLIDAFVADDISKVNRFFTSSEDLRKIEEVRNNKVKEYQDEMLKEIASLNAVSSGIASCKFAYLKHFNDFVIHLLGLSELDRVSCPWLTNTHPDLLKKIHEGIQHGRKVDEAVWEDPVIINALNTHLRDFAGKTEFLEAFIFYPVNYHERYKHIIDSFTGVETVIIPDNLLDEVVTNNSSAKYVAMDSETDNHVCPHCNSPYYVSISESGFVFCTGCYNTYSKS